MQRCAHHRRRSGRYVFRARRRGERRCGAYSLQSKTGGSGNSVVAMSVHRFAPDAPGLREDYRRRFPCFRRGTAGRGARGVLCRSRCRGHGAAARSRPAARIPDAFGKRRGISVSRLLLAQAGTHSDEGRAGEAERVSQYRRGGRRDRLRYSYRKRPRAGRPRALRRGRCAYTRPKR